MRSEVLAFCTPDYKCHTVQGRSIRKLEAITVIFSLTEISKEIPAMLCQKNQLLRASTSHSTRSSMLRGAAVQ